MELVKGPVSGYYIATYACPMGELGEQYIAYGRVFISDPKSFWDPLVPPMAELCFDDVRSNPDQAHQLAFERAVAHISTSQQLRSVAGEAVAT